MRDEHAECESQTSGGPKHRDPDIGIPFLDLRKINSAHAFEDDVDRSASGRPYDVHDQDRKRKMVDERVAESFF